MISNGLTTARRLPRQAQVGNGGNVPVRNLGDVLVAAATAVPGNLAPGPRGVVLVGQPALR